MLNELLILNSNGDSLSLPIPRGSDGYQVTEIEGLGPVPVALASSPHARLPGEAFHLAKKESRNIVLHIELVTSYWTTSVDERRQRLNRFFSPGGHLNMYFTTEEHGTLFIRGWMESVEENAWSSEQLYTVSIMCFSPLFNTLDKTTIIGTLPRTLELDYRGSEIGGIEATFWHAASSGNISFDSIRIGNTYATDDGMDLVLNTTVPLNSTLYVNTVPGSKAVRYRNYNQRPFDSDGSRISGSFEGMHTSVLGVKTQTSRWIELWPGYNKIELIPDKAVPNMRFKLEYSEYFGGI